MLQNNRHLLHKNHLINQILVNIKRDDYDNAAQIIKENNLTMESINKQTFKLSHREIAKLTDTLFYIK